MIIIMSFVGTKPSLAVVLRVLVRRFETVAEMFQRQIGMNCIKSALGVWQMQIQDQSAKLVLKYEI